MDNKKILALNGTLKIVTTSDHKFGTDAFILADFAKPRHKDLVCDFGTGCGIIPFILEKRFSPKHCVGVDIQKNAILQMEESVGLSGLKDKITPILGDIKTIDSQLKAGSFDVITCNPPYKKKNTGIENINDAHLIARHEILCNLEDICKSGFILLKQGGKLCICQRPERLLDVLDAMRKFKIEPKMLRFVAKEPTSQPWLFVVEGRKMGKENLKILPTLVLYDGDRYTAEMESIYGE